MAKLGYVLMGGSRRIPGRLFSSCSSPTRCAVAANAASAARPPVVFLFGGQGTQYVNMGPNLLPRRAAFPCVVDDCCDFLKPHLGRDLRELLYPYTGDEETARTSLQNTFYTQPSIFVIEYALRVSGRAWVCSLP